MRWIVPWFACHLVLWCCPAAAGEADAPRAPATAQVQEIRPRVYYVRDKDGNLVPMINWRYEDLMKAWRHVQRLQQQDHPPQYVLEQMSAAGTVSDNVAQLTVEFQILSQSDAWVRVPLRLGKAILRGESRYKGPGEHFLKFEGEGGGYVAWIRGKPGERHQLTLEMLVPLTSVGDETRLDLHAADATRSELKLTVPQAGVVGRVSEGPRLRTESPDDAGGETKGKTHFTVQQLRGYFQLAWYKPPLRARKTPIALEVVGELLVKVDLRGVNTEATLSVRAPGGPGGPFDRFRVRLPKGAELVPGSPSEYSLVPVKADARAAAEGQLVEVRFVRKSPEPPPVRLVTRQSHTNTATERWVDLAGFEVVGAVRQSGHIAVEAADGLYVVWGPRRGVRQADELPESLRRKDLVAGFEYSAQPCSLCVKAVQKKTRVSVDPEYLLLVEAEQVRLEATLRYSVRGAKAFLLDVELGDWELDEVGPENLVAVDGVQVSESKVLSIPLANASTGQFEVKVKAHRPIAEGTESLSLTFPGPRVNFRSPAAVVVQPADNVELIPDAEAIVGLVRQQIRPPMELPEGRQQDPFFYRGELAEAVLVADFHVRQQTVTVEVVTQVSLERRAGRVEQRLAYKIAHEPLERLTIRVPRSLVGSESIEFELDGQKVSPTIRSEQGNPTGAADVVEMWIALPPSSSIGTCELVIRYPLKPRQLAPKKDILCKIPLVMPGDGKLAGNRVLVTVPPAITVKHHRGPWSVPDGGSASRGGSVPRRRDRGLELSAPGPAAEVVLAVRLDSRSMPGSTVVRQGWVQTRLTRSSRQDRAAFRFTSNQKDIELLIPRAAADQPLELWLDGKSVVPKLARGNRLLVALPGDTNHREYLLELEYHFADGRPPRGRFSIELPGFGRAVWVRRMYWQLVLPQDEHVIVVPEDFVCEFHWGWNGTFWGRRPLCEQPQLESWIGARHEQDLPEGTNRYLFSSLGEIPGGELRTAGRAWIVLWASLAALVAGLSLIYVPASRHPATLLVVAVLLSIAWLIYPEPTLLLLQAASLGLVLTLLAGLLQRSVSRRRRGVALFEPSSSILEKDSTQTQYISAGVGHKGSSRTATTLGPPA